MTAAPADWFEVLEVDRDEVARVGYNLAAYAAEYESNGNDVEQRLMLATTLLDAATLLTLVDTAFARRLFAQAADEYEAVGAPDAWTIGLASHGAWRPSPDRDGVGLPGPNTWISELAILYHEQEFVRGTSARPGQPPLSCDLIQTRAGVRLACPPTCSPSS